MAMPIFSNRKPRVQYRDGMIYAELACESMDGTTETITIALTRHAAQALCNSITVSNALESAEVLDFSSRIPVSC